MGLYDHSLSTVASPTVSPCDSPISFSSDVSLSSSTIHLPKDSLGPCGNADADAGTNSDPTPVTAASTPETATSTPPSATLSAPPVTRPLAPQATHPM
ncbi:hypothetical protein Dimus_018487, partial [Dionaea muscipula]